MSAQAQLMVLRVTRAAVVIFTTLMRDVLLYPVTVNHLQDAQITISTLRAGLLTIVPAENTVTPLLMSARVQTMAPHATGVTTVIPHIIA